MTAAFFMLYNTKRHSYLIILLLLLFFLVLFLRFSQKITNFANENVVKEEKEELSYSIT